MRRKGFIIKGQVQGVGFRPFVYALARSLNLSGFVRNTPMGVEAEVQGPCDALEDFSNALNLRPPPLARIAECREQELPSLPGETDFRILPSLRRDHVQDGAGTGRHALISPDMAVCLRCREDMRRAQDRRYLYPFTNCTDCGPRYTITRALPYDRAGTSMACFPMCARCRAEYDDPANRRFHAQPNACPDCGPRLWYQKSPADQGKPLEGSDALRAAARLLESGGILALKGLGGFHLACNACDDAAVLRLRDRKGRPHKAFALMVPDLDTARALVRIGPDEEALLTSPEHPIVLCEAGDGPATAGLAAGLSPDNSSLGLMLPYTPLHLALFAAYGAALRGGSEQAAPRVLVMTSGNPRGEPLCLGNREALSSLGSMADGFLLHDRDILVRVDDSVQRPLPGRGTLLFRRGRGYAPRPLLLPSREKKQQTNRKASVNVSTTKASPVILGAGAEHRVTLCFTRGDYAFVSQYIGDLENPATLAFYRETADHLGALLGVRPEAVVRDAHPDYMSSILAEESGLPVFRLQHHYAHAHALLAEHRYCAANADAPVLVLALDGTGLGEDGTLWGGEALLIRAERAGTPPAHRRLAHFAPMTLPGGEAAVREPWRAAHSLIHALGLARPDDPPLPWLPDHEATARLLPSLAESPMGTWQSTSCGRLFDAVAATLGLCNAITYDGQAAVRLEEIMYRRPGGFLPADRNEPAYPCPALPPGSGRQGWLLDTHTLFAAVWADWRKGLPAPVISRRFHLGLARGIADLAALLAAEHGFRRTGLTGGCLQNRTLALETAAALENKGLIPLLHREVSPNDEGISLGQAAWGRLVLG